MITIIYFADHPFSNVPNTTFGCVTMDTLTNQVSGYLFPFLVEYHLIAAAILSKMLSNIQDQEQDEPTEIESEWKPETPEQNNSCVTFNIGLIWGILLFALTIISTCIFIVNNGDNPGTPSSMVGHIFFATDIFLNVLSTIIALLALCQLRRLTKVKGPLCILNRKLEIICVCGFYLLLGFGLVAVLNYIIVNGVKGLFTKCHVIDKVMNFAQATVQIVLVMEGMQRRATKIHHLETKPGRALITFLVICNLSMWIVNTFQLKELTGSPIFITFYGRLAWTLLVHMTLPFAVLYRFHSSVCLSDIWLNAYAQHPRCIIDQATQEAQGPIVSGSSSLPCSNSLPSIPTHLEGAESNTNNTRTIV